MATIDPSDRRATSRVRRALVELRPVCRWTSGTWTELRLGWNELQNLPGHVRMLSNFQLERLASDAPDRGEVDPQHHRVDHEPDQHGDREVHVADLEPAQPLHQSGAEPPDGDARDDAEHHPDRQIALEDAEAFRRRGGRHRTRRRPVSPFMRKAG